MGIGKTVAKQLGSRAHKILPGMTASVVHEALNQAIHGVGPLPGAALAADRQLAEQRGDVDKAIHEVIENNVRLAGVQGFLTNIGGLVTLPVTIPVNVTGLAVVQCRMVAGIAHLRGYDIEDPRVRNAILACVLGEDAVVAALSKKRIPASPYGIATAAAYDPVLNEIMASELTTELIGRAAGKRVVGVLARRIPVAGGFIGLGADGFSTWRVGRYADRELLPVSPGTAAAR
ncbi:MAG: EcsC family protein [Nocardioidaceae bacterium]